MKITIPCKRKDCPGYVTYVEEDVPGVVQMIVRGLVLERRTKRVFLACNNFDDPHEYPYEIEVTLEDASNDVLGHASKIKDSDAD